MNWTSVTKSPDEVSFVGYWGQSVEKYRNQTYMITYIENNWFSFKEKFVYHGRIKLCILKIM